MGEKKQGHRYTEQWMENLGTGQEARTQMLERRPRAG